MPTISHKASSFAQRGRDIAKRPFRNLRKRDNSPSVSTQALVTLPTPADSSSTKPFPGSSCNTGDTVLDKAASLSKTSHKRTASAIESPEATCISMSPASAPTALSTSPDPTVSLISRPPTARRNTAASLTGFGTSDGSWEMVNGPFKCVGYIQGTDKKLMVPIDDPRQEIIPIDPETFQRMLCAPKGSVSEQMLSGESYGSGSFSRFIAEVRPDDEIYKFMNNRRQSWSTVAGTEAGNMEDSGLAVENMDDNNEPSYLEGFHYITHQEVLALEAAIEREERRFAQPAGC